jgi:hypothetical protein
MTFTSSTSIGPLPTAMARSITISRIEKGMPCRMETQRKILLALGFKLSDKPKIFKD